MRKTTLSGVLSLSLLAGLPIVGGCGEYGGGSRGDHHSYGTSYGTAYHEDYRDHAQQAGDRNTRVADRADDGRLNGSARSYEERKASRAADQGDYDAARRESELRREREYGR